MRAAFLRPENASGVALAAVLAKALVFNGKTALENSPDYREIAFDDSAPAGDVARTSAAAVEEVAAFAPQFLFMGTHISELGARLEAAWRRGTPRPMYLLPATPGKDAPAFVGKDEGLRHRVFSVSVPSTPENAQFVNHYNAAYDDKVSLTFAPNDVYDALYVLAYAIHAIGRGEVTGPAISRAIERLGGEGAAVEVGPERHPRGIQRPATRGEHPPPRHAREPRHGPGDGREHARRLQSCACRWMPTGERTDGSESGVVYRARNRVLEGVLRCP